MKMMRKIAVATIAVMTTSLFALAGCSLVGRYDRYANADLYVAGSASVSAEVVKKVEIDWLNGNIEVEQTSSQALQLVEDNPSEREEERMHYYLDGNILKVKYCQAGLRTNINAEKKNLRLELPMGLSLEIDAEEAGIALGVLEVGDLSIETKSGNITAERVVCGEAEIETQSGKVSMGEIVASKASFETNSGAVSVAKLAVDFLDVDTNRGKLSFGLEKALTAEVESTSADIKFTLGDGLGASVVMRTATGKLKTEKEYAKAGSRYDIFGSDGVCDCKIEVDVFSGDVYID